ncbi:MAG TPA: hypothetical protein VM491_03530 [Burkholderiaceae bacterium]|nr:hypothetical protein [Burkholderiaceae bacterium]
MKAREREINHGVAIAAAVVALLLTPSLGRTQESAPAGSIFVCKDARGRTLTADRPIPECAAQPMRELRSDGALRREIAPPPTAEQRERQLQDRAQQQRELDERRQAQARDRALLHEYRDVAALEGTRRRLLAELDADIAAALDRSRELAQQISQARAQVDAHERGNPRQPVPPQLLQQLSGAAAALAGEQALIDKRRGDQQQVNQRFDADLRRLRELTERPQVWAADATQPVR